MKLLLDTNVFIWASREPHFLSEKARRLLSSSRNECFVSIASLWEMQIKHSSGKLPLPSKVEDLAGPWLQALGAELLPLGLRHVSKLYDLPFTHLDPFDRILIAQAISEGLQIVSPDKTLPAYNVPVVW